MSKIMKSVIAFGFPLIVLLLPREFFPVQGLTEAEYRVIALFLFAALSWVLEPIPVFATSVLVIMIELLILSDSGIAFLTSAADPEKIGTLLSYKSILATFADPLIMLFIGGIFIAMASTKYRLDQNLARVFLKPFGNKPKRVLLGLMIITAVFSMFMSNTATTAMMLAIMAPVTRMFELNDKGRVGFLLSVPIAANIGGIGTPIGTPPNIIALKYLTGADSISFGNWMLFGVPYVIVLLVLSWMLLLYFFPIKLSEINLSIESKFMKSTKAYIVYAVTGLTILLWLTDFLHGINSYVVAMIPVAIFAATKVITKDELKELSWDVLWLVSGGIALGLAIEQTGLAKNLIAAVPFGSLSPFLIVIAAVLLTFAMANFMSHTATANLLLPIIASLAVNVDALSQIGGVRMLILSVTFVSSVGMSLPISTPPNALAFAVGGIETKEMAKTGVLIGIIGILLTFLLMYVLKLVNFI